MKTGLLLITHGPLGQEMLNTVVAIMSECPLQAHALSVSNDCDPEEEFKRACAAVEALDKGDGVLVLNDLYGSTPSNIAQRLLDHYNVQVIAGVNVPMLLRVLNYPAASLDKLVETAAEGAHNGVVVSGRKEAS